MNRKDYKTEKYDHPISIKLCVCMKEMLMMIGFIIINNDDDDYGEKIINDNKM